ncbi:MAG: hypothetical protein HY866_02700 [Chloroflexi bacterium]|nr:hypothetical protein [Chloroflexota bacterium]
MVIGSVLLQPQRLERASQRSDDDAVLDDLISLAVCLISDGIEGGSVSETLAGSIYGTIDRLAERTGAGANHAASRLVGLFQPLIEPIQALGEPPDNAVDLIDGLEGTLETIANILKNLTPTQLRHLMDEIFDILETDLGITPTFVQDLVLGVFSDMILALQQAPPNETPARRTNRRSVAGSLSRLRRFIQQSFVFPSLNADDAAQALLGLLLRPDVEEALTFAVCAGEAATAYVHAGQTLTDLIPYSGFAPFGEGGLGAAATAPDREEICFYASKLLEYDNINGDLGKLPLGAEVTLFDGRVDEQLHKAFLDCSVVLARSAFLYTVEENKEWTVVDRKKYIVRWLTGTQFVVYRLFEMSESSFLSLIGDEDKSKLRKEFRQNGFLLLESDTILVEHTPNSNLWVIKAGIDVYNAFTFENTITIHPTTPARILFNATGDFQADLSAKELPDSLQQIFTTNGIPLTSKVSVSVREIGSQWVVDDGDFEYTVKKDAGKFEVSTGDFWGWLFSTIKKPKGHMVWVNVERTQVLLGQRIMHVGTDVSWQDAPVFKRLNGNRHFSVGDDADTIEDWAYYTSIVQDAANMASSITKIIVSIKKEKVQYSIASNSLEFLRLLLDWIVKLAQQRPMGELIGLGRWYDLIVDIVSYTAKGIEALVKALTEEETPDENPTASGFSKALDSMLSVVSVDIPDIPGKLGEVICEFLLSLRTLMNHVEPPQPSPERPENFKESGAFVDVFWMTGLLVYTAAIPSDEYALPFQTTSLTAGYWLGGAFGIGLVGGFLGILAGQGGIAKMNVFEDGGHLAKTLLKSTGKSLLYFWPYLKLFKGKNE